ncbi:hypothetical protein cand_029910 [Cryptosporidium andersoni]|uniref:Uncharacterized protein n=1 Tax=Cryptosporidium andersoni TaxID=117008 RepID=A0A1J4MNA4_9CRYT|nr:hypothetical protein cand_029910 [Cryptosporidium andersoni]
MENRIEVRKAALEKISERLLQEFDESEPENIPYFIVDFLCKNYGDYLCGFAKIWNGEFDFEQERLAVIDFFRSQLINMQVTADFISAGYDTLESLCTVTPDDLANIEKFSESSWLPGHKIRLQQIFSDIVSRVQQWRDERERALQKPCQHQYTTRMVNMSGTTPKLPVVTGNPSTPYCMSSLSQSIPRY